MFNMMQGSSCIPGVEGKGSRGKRARGGGGGGGGGGSPEVLQGDSQMQVNVEELTEVICSLGRIHALQQIRREKGHIHSHLCPGRVLQCGCQNNEYTSA